MIHRTTTHVVNLYAGTVDVRDDSPGWHDPYQVAPWPAQSGPVALAPESTDSGLRSWRRYWIAEKI